MLFSLYNHSQRLWGGADGTSINTMNLNLHVDVGGRREASIKWGMGGNLEDSENHYHSTRTRKSSSDCAKDQPSLINSVHLCLIVINIILTVIHALKPSSLTHFLQIYCTGFTGLRSHISWAWVAKCVPTVILIFLKEVVAKLYPLFN